MSIRFEPDYYKEFQCKQGACRRSCCNGWRISLNRQDYFRLIGLDCSGELHHRLECAFGDPDYPTESHFKMIQPNWLGRCHLLTEDGLCLIHKECGGDALPTVCRLYPRSIRTVGEVTSFCCSGSCERVIELLSARDSLHFETAETDTASGMAAQLSPESPYIRKACLSAIQDRSLSLEERLRKIGSLLGNGKMLSLPDFSGKLPALFSLSDTLREYEGHWASLCPDDPLTDRLIENLLANHLLYTDFPYTDARLQPADAVSGLLALFFLLKTCSCPEGEEQTDMLAAVFHLTEHTPYYYNARVIFGK